MNHLTRFIRARGLPGLRFTEYALDRWSLFMVADEAALRFAFFGCTLKDRRVVRDEMPEGETPPLAQARRFLDAWGAGRSAPLPDLDHGRYTAAQRRVYECLLEVPAGSTISYGDLAARAGHPGAARFVGTCMAVNDFPVFIPCHRVIKADGTLGSYGGGTDIKAWLLRHEGARWRS